MPKKPKRSFPSQVANSSAIRKVKAPLRAILDLFFVPVGEGEIDRKVADRVGDGENSDRGVQQRPAQASGRTEAKIS